MDKHTENLAAIESLAVLSEQEAAEVVAAGCTIDQPSDEFHYQLVESVAAGCTFDAEVVASGCSDDRLPSGCADDKMGVVAESIGVVNSLAAGCSIDTPV